MSGFRLPKTGSRLPDYLSRCLTLNHLNTLDPIRRPLLPVCCLPPQVLGVSKDCSERDVTRAYRKQVPPPRSQSASKQMAGVTTISGLQSRFWGQST